LSSTPYQEKDKGGGEEFDRNGDGRGKEEDTLLYFAHLEILDPWVQKEGKEVARKEKVSGKCFVPSSLDSGVDEEGKEKEEEKRLPIHSHNPVSKKRKEGRRVGGKINHQQSRSISVDFLVS